MTRDDIIATAIKAGWSYDSLYMIQGTVSMERLERFAELVAAAEREAIIDLVAFHGGSVEIEADIRARGANDPQ